MPAHSGTNNKQPAIDATLEEVLSDQTSGEKKEQKVKQLQVTHGLERTQTLEAGRKHDHQAHDGLKCTVRKKSARNRHQGRIVLRLLPSTAEIAGTGIAVASGANTPSHSYQCQ